MCLWLEACYKLSTFLNRYPHILLKDKTPKKAFHVEMPQVTHIFMYLLSSLYQCLIKRTKFEPLSIKGIFVGNRETSNAHWTYIPAQLKTMVSQEVKFDEYGWSSKSHEPQEGVKEGENLAVPKAVRKEKQKSDLD